MGKPLWQFRVTASVPDWVPSGEFGPLSEHFGPQTANMIHELLSRTWPMIEWNVEHAPPGGEFEGVKP